MTINKNANTKQKSRSKTDSFLEAFRELGLSSPKSKSDSSLDQEMFFRESEIERKYRSRIQRSEDVRREEKILFTRQERETKSQVKALQSEIQKLAKATGELASQTEVVALQEIPNAGSYHISFLEKLIAIVKFARSQIEESSAWLESWNKKASRKNAYWGQFKKSGSKFLLSADRYMATQAG